MTERPKVLHGTSKTGPGIYKAINLPSLNKEHSGNFIIFLLYNVMFLMNKGLIIWKLPDCTSLSHITSLTKISENKC